MRAASVSRLATSLSRLQRRATGRAFVGTSPCQHPAHTVVVQQRGWSSEAAARRPSPPGTGPEIDEEQFRLFQERVQATMEAASAKATADSVPPTQSVVIEATGRQTEEESGWRQTLSLDSGRVKLGLALFALVTALQMLAHKKEQDAYTSAASARLAALDAEAAATQTRREVFTEAERARAESARALQAAREVLLSGLAGLGTELKQQRTDEGRRAVLSEYIERAFSNTGAERAR